MNSLYNIDRQLVELDAAMDMELEEHFGEITDTYGYMEEQLASLEMRKEDALEQIGLLALEMRAQADAVEKIEKEYKEKKQSLRAKAARYEGWINKSLAGVNFSTDRVSITFRESEYTDVEGVNVDTLPDKYCTIKRSPSATAIKKAIKAGEDIPGAFIGRRTNMTIK